MCILCATSDLFLKYLDAIVATYKTRHMKQAYETLAKTPKKYLKTIANICNIQMKHSLAYI
jgi:hypothetical protein